ncbi:uncharacterized protein LOC113291406 [Papaver somniferum]|uniref:uncharacterized protein LOC113291406 n=1 Tax=Papaver somniferum TaxID=3469 RepID=UPI000E6F75D4|nr:uncharacterized protein LOC113291406 [Papaver somniferum]
MDKSSQEISTWVSPPDNWIKFNTDGAWNLNSSNGGMGIITKDSKESFIYAESTNLICYSVEEAEVKAIREALKIALVRKDKKIILESDASGIVELINKKIFLGDHRTHSSYEDIRTLSQNFSFLQFVYVNRVRVVLVLINKLKVENTGLGPLYRQDNNSYIQNM